MLVVKIVDGQTGKTGMFIFRKGGTRYRPGEGAAIARDDTIFAKRDGTVKFKRSGERRFVTVAAPE